MSWCRNCGGGLFAGPAPYFVDGLVCRACQKNPAVQLRVLLEDSRRHGLSFDEAFDLALGTPPEFKDSLIRWPHDTTHRIEWKAILGDLREVSVGGQRFYVSRGVQDTRETWRGAYEGEPSSDREKTLQGLALAA